MLMLNRSPQKPATSALLLAALMVPALVGGPVRADEFCMSLAETYFEQVYCELQARGEARSLPPFYEFRNNDGTTQALLLKRPAARLGLSIRVPRDRPRVAVPRELPAEATVAPAQSVQPAQPPGYGATLPSRIVGTEAAPGCRFVGHSLECSGTRFQLLGNRNNSRLAADALSPENRMSLPRFAGVATSVADVRAYLSQVYRRYIEKMLEIGLGGSTMTFSKFAYLFQDLTEKGIDFAERSETMFSYLKKDKGRIGVSEAVSPPAGLDPRHCQPLGPQLVACDGGQKNYLYASD